MDAKQAMLKNVDKQIQNDMAAHGVTKNDVNKAKSANGAIVAQAIHKKHLTLNCVNMAISAVMLKNANKLL